MLRQTLWQLFRNPGFSLTVTVTALACAAVVPMRREALTTPTETLCEE